MRTSPQLVTGLLGTTLVLAASCTLDLAGLPGSTSTSASAASGGGSGTSASSAASGNGGAGGSITSSPSSSGSSSSAGSSSGTGGAGPTLVIAGELLVDLDVDDPTAGTPTWHNKGTLGGDFKEQGKPTKGTSGDKDAVVFDGDDAYVGPSSTSTIEGKDDRSIEVWVLNPVVSPSEESMLSWSDRENQTKGKMVSFNYGKDLNWSAMTHWDGTGLSWGDASAMPPESRWHHLAYTYDGTAAIVFADGVKKAEKTVTLDTEGGYSINIAAQRKGSGLEQHGSLAIAVIRVHSGALTAAEVKSNYEAEKTRFP